VDQIGGLEKVGECWQDLRGFQLLETPLLSINEEPDDSKVISE